MRYNIHPAGEKTKLKKGDKMIQQTVMPFKLKRTEERMTSRSGLALYAEFMKAMGADELVSKYMPKPGSGNGLEAINYVKPLSMTLYGGGETIEDVREIRNDNTLKGVISPGKIPSSSAIGDWLKRMGRNGGIEGMEKVNDAINTELLKRDGRKGYTLIIDPTIIEAEKRDAMMTYLGFKGYRPVISTLKETGLAIAYEFKEGNNNGGRVDILKKSFSKIAKSGKEIKEVLLDAEYYTNEVIEYLTNKGAKWAIGVDKDRGVMEAIKAIPEADWKPLVTRDGISTGRNVSETVYTTNKGKQAFRLIVLRWQDRQMGLFKDTYHYHCISTNMEEDKEEVVWRYNERAHIENHIKELKSGFGMEYLPSGDFRANAVHFGIGIMTYNLFIAQKLLTMPETLWEKTIKSIRWLIVEVPGKLIEHGRRTILKIAAGKEKYNIIRQMRQSTYELLVSG